MLVPANGRAYKTPFTYVVGEVEILITIHTTYFGEALAGVEL